MEQHEYLAHHGIRGMKWGFRRFQNPDGTLTEEGRRRYGVGVASRKAYEKSARYKAKSDAYALKSKRAIDRYDQFKSDKMKRKSEEYAAKASSQYAKAVKLENKDDRIVNRKYSESDIYALEGAKRGGLLGAAIGKAVGVYKVRKEEKAKERAEQFAKENAELESKTMYDASANNRFKPLKQRVNDTEEQLQKICDAHINRLSDVMASIPGHFDEYNPFNAADYIYDGSFAQSLAIRFNDSFDVDHTFDQRMDEYVHDYRNGLISKKEFTQNYEAELNDFSARLIDTYKIDDLKKIAKTFVDPVGDGEYELNTPSCYWKNYLKRVDSWEGVDSNKMNRQNSTKSSGRYSVGSKHSEDIADTSKSGKARAEFSEPHKSSGRYTIGRNENSSRGSMMDIVSQDKKNWRVTTNKNGEREAEYIGPGKNVNTQVKSLRNAGYTYREIEQTLGISSSKISEILS